MDRNWFERFAADPAGLDLIERFFQFCSEGMLITDAGRRIIQVNPAFSRITGYRPEDVLGRDPGILQSRWHDRNFYRRMWRSIRDSGQWQGEIWDRRQDGELFVQRLIIQAIRHEGPAVSHYLGIMEDITHRKAWRERLEYLQQHDPLTGLPNRILLQDRLQHAIETARAGNGSVALLILDIDRFRTLNEGLGHDGGDRLLMAVAERLRQEFPRPVTLARLEIDRFALILEGQAAIDPARLALQIREELFQAPLRIGQRDLTISLSIGFDRAEPGAFAEAAGMIRGAEGALQAIKRRGGGLAAHDLKMSAVRLEKFHLEWRMRRALRRQEYELHFQPQIDAMAGRLTGAEVLLRWRDPEEGLVRPDAFIPLSEEIGLILPLGEWILRSSGEVLRRWALHPALQQLRLAVNLSARQFQDPELPQRIRELLREFGIIPARLEMEITESAAMEDAESALAILTRIKSLGGSLAIDDFGTGYSSLGYLKRFPVDKLKIDRSFITGLPENPEDRAIARTILEMARALELRSIAEGVETAAQVRCLRELGCREFQGFFFGRPMPLDEFEAWVEDFDFSRYALDSPETDDPKSETDG